MATNSFYCWLKYLVIAFAAASFLFLEIDMSEARFTKGVWELRESIHEGGFEVSFNKDGELITDYIYEEADAHLIAAAPEMYNLLERLTNPNNCKKDIIHLLGEADNLLAKARGE